MNDKWKISKIEEVAEKVGMGPFGSSIKVETFVAEGIPIISGQHLHETRLEDHEYDFISLAHADKLKNANVFRGDIIFTHAGNIGHVAYIPSTSKYERYILSQRQFYMRCDRSKILPEFVTYYFKTPEGRHKLLANKSQTGVPSIAQPVTYLRSIEVPVPPLEEQSAIIKILSDLEYKIELNTKINKALESIAHALFRRWFVNVKSNEYCRAADLIDFDPRIPMAKGRPVPYVDMKSLSEGDMLISGFVEKPFSGGSRFQNNDTLLARITPCLENGKTGFMNILKNQSEVAFGSTEFIVMRPKSGVSPQFVYCLARDPQFRDCAIQSMVGSSGRQRVQADVLADYAMVRPHKDEVVRFDSVTNPFFQQIKKNREESIVLYEIRNSILPKLMSGRIRVYNAI